MSIEDYKRGVGRVEDQAIENGRRLFARIKHPFSWKNRGSWHNRPPQKHPGWAAYHHDQCPQSEHLSDAPKT